ncbi:uncharacterized protein QC763_0080280 [Podospora pseudopauciseta]|uniref:Uncharacterized protein n=1 Tax=Podospora pseudopauciseta TaxID=2093780 RepID=A0ABR0H779_9PEZI|nr:hypothetical protein QC763_0080280 [Podospora pseudopauciseta]
MLFHSLASQEFLWAGGALSGVAIHLTLFIRGEWHVHAPEIICAYGALVAVSTLAGILYEASIIGQALACHLLGPAEVTVFLPEAPDVMTSRHSNCVKAEFYDLI